MIELSLDELAEKQNVKQFDPSCLPKLSSTNRDTYDEFDKWLKEHRHCHAETVTIITISPQDISIDDIMRSITYFTIA